MKNKLKIWDLPVRLLHWLLVSSIAAAWYTSEDIGPLHEYCGYSAAFAVAARLLWSFAGSSYARFPQFVLGAGPTMAYLRQVLAGTAPRYLGHNPLGGWMVVALLSCVGLVAFTGWLTTTELLWGYAWPVRIHESLAWLLVALIAAHVGGVIFTSWQHRENLVAAMFSGNKSPEESPETPAD
ncbi:cytochrome b/b6 domain-containing protein [Pseudoduganella aquatica]|uniref:cytochrome b/b6 domain-containing protein n=1 Tax=Pseudoduganella aquatica TaxID=2660641 RepID=UPI001E6279D8|nr:cytochrome b/b6 domain-containing protein [Pseudoduganella aquatica]